MNNKKIMFQLYILLLVSLNTLFSQKMDANSEFKNIHYPKDLNEFEIDYNTDKPFIYIAPSVGFANITEDETFTVTLSFDIMNQDFYMMNDSLTITEDYSPVPVIKLDAYTYEISAPASSYTFFIPYYTPKKFVIKENVIISTDTTISFQQSDANRKIDFNPVDENNESLQSSNNINSVAELNIMNRITYGFGINSSIQLMFSDFNGPSKFVSSQIFLLENNPDKIVGIHFPPLRNLNSDTILTNNPADFVNQYIKVNFPPNSESRKVLLYEINSTSSFLMDYGLSIMKNYPVTSNTWTVNFFTNQELYGELVTTISIEPQYNNINEGLSYFPLRVYDGRIGCFYGLQPSPNTFLSNSGDTLTYGVGCVYASGMHLNKLDGGNTINVSSHFYDTYNRKRNIDDYYSMVTIKDSLNEILYSGNSSDFSPLLVDPGPYQTKIINDNYFVNDSIGRIELQSNFDLRKEDSNPPVLTSLRILKENDKIILKFSLADITIIDSTSNNYTSRYLKYKTIIADSTRLMVKNSDSEQWLDLPLEKIVEDQKMKKEIRLSSFNSSNLDILSFLPAGIVYSANIDIYSNLLQKDIDLKIYAIDDNGNQIQYTIKPVSLFLKNNISSIGLKSKNKIGFKLYKCYPNPFNPSTHITYSIDKPGQITLTIYNLLGEKIDTIVNEYQYKGNYDVPFDGSNLSSGLYFCTLQSGSIFQTQKMLLIK